MAITMLTVFANIETLFYEYTTAILFPHDDTIR